jgi:hypothetical protein
LIPIRPFFFAPPWPWASTSVDCVCLATRADYGRVALCDTLDLLGGGIEVVGAKRDAVEARRLVAESGGFRSASSL